MQLLEQIQTLNFPAPLPPALLAVRQQFDAPQVTDVTRAARQALTTSGLLRPMAPGDTVAVGVGSRGIANLPVIVKTVVEQLKNAGMNPFVPRSWAATAEPPPKGKLPC